MKFSIIWHPRAAKYVEHLPKKDAERILVKMDFFAEDPFRFLEHFEGGGYKLRIGDYRAIVDIDAQLRILKVRVFDKRGRIY